MCLLGAAANESLAVTQALVNAHLSLSAVDSCAEATDRHERVCRLGWALFVAARAQLQPGSPDLAQQYQLLLAVVHVLCSWAPLEWVRCSDMDGCSGIRCELFYIAANIGRQYVFSISE